MPDRARTPPSQLLFLPGASGDVHFWRALARDLTHPAGRVFLDYPGFGDAAPAPHIDGMRALLERVLERIDRPTALIAQSMGGVLAIQAALARPELVTHLVLTATSGGIDMAALGARDWRPVFAAAKPNCPAWFLADRADLAPDLGRIAAPTLLLWGDADPISPLAVGRRLLAGLPHARLHVVAGGEHDLGQVHAARLAPLVDAHLS